MLQIRNFSPEQIIEHKSRAGRRGTADLAFLEDLASDSCGPVAAAPRPCRSLSCGSGEHGVPANPGEEKFAEEPGNRSKFMQKRDRFKAACSNELVTAAAFNAVMDACVAENNAERANSTSGGHSTRRQKGDRNTVRSDAASVGRIKSAEILAEKETPNAITDAGAPSILPKQRLREPP